MINISNKTDRALQARRVEIKGDGTIGQAGPWVDFAKRSRVQFLDKYAGLAENNRPAETMIEVRLKVRRRR